MAGSKTKAVRFFASWSGRPPAGARLSEGGVLGFADIGELTIEEVGKPWGYDELLAVRLDDGRDPPRFGLAKRRRTMGPAGLAVVGDHVRFEAAWTSDMPLDAGFALGDLIEFVDIGELAVTAVSSRGKFRSSDPDLLLVWLDHGSERRRAPERHLYIASGAGLNRVDIELDRRLWKGDRIRVQGREYVVESVSPPALSGGRHIFVKVPPPPSPPAMVYRDRLTGRELRGMRVAAERDVVLPEVGTAFAIGPRAGGWGGATAHYRVAEIEDDGETFTVLVERE